MHATALRCHTLQRLNELSRQSAFKKLWQMALQQLLMMRLEEGPQQVRLTRKAISHPLYHLWACLQALQKVWTVRGLQLMAKTNTLQVLNK